MHTDPIADFLTRIRNAAMARHLKIDVPFSKMKVAISEILVKEGYVKNFKVNQEGEKPSIRLYLKYVGGDLRQPVIRGISRESRPGLRKYVSRDCLQPVQNGFGVAIVSTSKGVLTDAEARKQNIGGELICSVW